MFMLNGLIDHHAGAYQVANPDASQSIVSKLMSVNQTQQSCNTNYPGVPSSPAVDHINKYGGWNMTPSRTFFSSGECKDAALAHECKRLSCIIP
jgi:hypothetical protein